MGINYVRNCEIAERSSTSSMCDFDKPQLIIWILVKTEQNPSSRVYVHKIILLHVALKKTHYGKMDYSLL